MVWSLQCPRLWKLTFIFWGTAYQWITNDRSLIWNFIRTSVQTRTVRRYEHSWPYFDALLEVPVIVVFTKYDQFLRNVEMHLFDYPEEYPDSDVSEAVKQQFREHYLDPLGDDIQYVRLESMFIVKYKDYILMLCERDAQTRRALWRSHWEDCGCIEWWDCWTDVIGCAEGKLGIECKSGLKPVSMSLNLE